MPKKEEKFREWEVTKTQVTCPYCGVGCQMNLLVKDNKVVGTEPVKDALNNGLLCVKGRFAYHFINSEDRVQTPLIKRDGKFEEATWDEAYDLIESKMSGIKEKHGPDAIGFFGSGKTTLEDNYMLQKFARAVIGTNNVDCCARL
jgi:formate dehydrogenase major subunit